MTALIKAYYAAFRTIPPQFSVSPSLYEARRTLNGGATSFTFPAAYVTLPAGYTISAWQWAITSRTGELINPPFGLSGDFDNYIGTWGFVGSSTQSTCAISVSGVGDAAEDDNDILAGAAFLSCTVTVGGIPYAAAPGQMVYARSAGFGGGGGGGGGGGDRNLP